MKDFEGVFIIEIIGDPEDATNILKAVKDLGYIIVPKTGTNV